ncbi:hypothetical protein HYFRA_00013221 [Hymenoscyphus fraxineus]|uniref:Uncharacterized protein n=1 Tax=Hymenoscyphus fraxineus TaxID=746836 RepID=A0A9N9L8I7_9HELO|nr:hypothetical protein HYFRA_00013221 [Hymenoscyphus fraxineus]
MQYSFALAALFSATIALPLPLNINLGAYSPALVVGDGAISFGAEGAGGAGAKPLMEALSGAGVSGPGAAKGLIDGANTPEASSVSINPPALSDGAGLGRVVRPREGGDEEEDEAEVKAEVGAPVVSKRDIGGFNAALSYALGAVKVTPEVQLGTGEHGAGVGILVKPGITAAAAAGPAKGGKAE